MTISPWRSWLLFSALVILGCGYIAAYAFFLAHSENFIVVQRNRRALAFAQAHAVSLPVTWTFGNGRAENALLGDGWVSVRGQTGVEMTQNDAWVMLGTTAGDTDLSLTLYALFVTTPAAPRNRVEVSVNGQVLGSWERGGADQDKPIEVRVPANLMKDGRCRLKVHVDRLASRYRPDAGPLRNGQHVLLGAIALDKADAAAASASVH